MTKKKITEAQKLKEKIEKLDELEMYSIYQILDKHDVNITKNSNGIFFDLLTLKPDIFKILKKFIEETMLRKKIFEDNEQINNNLDDIGIDNSCNDVVISD